MTLEDLYERYEAELYRYAAQLSRDPDRADDLVQDTFMRVVNHLPLLELLEPYQRRAWLRRTLKNLFLDQESRRQRREALIEALAWELPEAYDLPRAVTRTNPFDLVPERYRELFEMRYVLGMNSREIGEQLGIPAATVRSRLHLALQEMRRQAWKLG
jgi:RNA polymerase sigma-70 factor (ECF subfamily)